jgi:hypothetical protein
VLGELGKLVPLSEQLELIRQELSNLTRAKYEIREASQEFPPAIYHSRWYVFATQLEELQKTSHATASWEDVNRNVYIESTYLGDTGKLVETEYGEEGAIAAFKLDYSDFDAARKILAEKFPRVGESLKDYEKMVAEVASKHNVNLRIRYDIRKGGATFYVNAKIEAKSLDSLSKTDRIRLNVGAMKEAWRSIERYEAKRRHP